MLVDGWFRSRSLELPGHGVAMVPVIDMLNHSKSPNAYFDSIRGSGADGSVVIHLMPEAGTVQPNDEITISYGATKSIAEMVFSYGFVPVSSSLSDTDQVVPAATAKVPLEPMEDDPLAKAKAYVLPTPPLVDLRLEKDESDSDDGGGSPQWRASWSSPWAWLACLNEEDGLHFRVARSVETSGDADSTLVLNWDDDDVTSRAAEMESIVAGHELEKVFRLRVVTVVKQGLVSILDDGAEALSQNGPPVGPCRQSCVDAALAVLRSERLLFELAREELAHEVSLRFGSSSRYANVVYSKLPRLSTSSARVSARKGSSYATTFNLESPAPSRRVEAMLTGPPALGRQALRRPRRCGLSRPRGTADHGDTSA